MAQGYQLGLGSGGLLRDHGHVAAGDGGQVDPDTALIHQPVAGFGDGSDGDVVIAVNTTLARDMSYNNLAINGGVTLSTAGFVIRVRGTLLNNGTIACSGGAGGNGVGFPLGTGGAGGLAPYVTVTAKDYIGHPNNGGAGASAAASGGNNGAGGVAGSAAVPGDYSSFHLWSGSGGGGGGNHALVAVAGGLGGSVFVGRTAGAGGAGIGAGDDQLGGGGGGAGAGVLLIYAFVINNAGSILARGGAGGNGINGGGGNFSGNGGGGGGGSIIILYRTATALGTRTVTGGAAGVGGNGGAAGAAGASYAMQV